MAGTTPLGILASGTSKTSGTTLVVTFTQDVAIGTHLTLVLGHDNHAATTASTVTLPATIGGVAPSLRLNPAGSGVTTTAGSGIFLRWWTWVTTAAITSGTTFTITFGSAVVAKSAMIVGALGITNTPATGASTSASGGTAGTVSRTTGGTAPTPPAVVIGVAAAESTTFTTPDTDTLNGTWSPLYQVGTTGGQDATNVSVALQMKEITASGIQTFNAMGGSGDIVASTLSLVCNADTASAPFIGWGIPI